MIHLESALAILAYPEGFAPETQQYDSADTSRSAVPAIFGAVERTDGWQQGTVNVDVGGGKYDTFTEALAKKGVENFILDPYNRDDAHNDQVAARLVQKPADTATISNVLNVVQEPEERQRILQLAHQMLKDGGTVYVTVYTGDGGGKPGPTRDGWQENRPLESYLEEIQAVFPDAEKTGSVIRATKAKATHGHLEAALARLAGMQLTGSVTFMPALGDRQRQEPLDVQDASTVFIQDLARRYRTVRINPMWSGVDMSSTRYDAPTGVFNIYPAEGVDLPTIQPALEAIAEQWRQKGWQLTTRVDDSRMTGDQVFRVTIESNPTTGYSGTPQLNLANGNAQALLALLGLTPDPQPPTTEDYQENPFQMNWGEDLSGSIGVADLARRILRARNTTGRIDELTRDDVDTNRPSDLKPFVDMAGFRWDQQWGDAWAVYWTSDQGTVGITRSFWDDQSRDYPATRLYSVWGTDLTTKQEYSYSSLPAPEAVRMAARQVERFGGDASRIGPDLARAMMREVNQPAPKGPRVMARGLTREQLERYLEQLEGIVKWCRENHVSTVTWA